MKDTLPVVEIFGPTIQGEGSSIGQPTIFVRLGGCDYACSWCDSKHAVDAKRFKHTWTPMRADEIMLKVLELTDHVPCLVTLSGGNPALHDCGPLLKLGHAEHYTFTMETQGTVLQDWMTDLDQLCVSPKPPSSGMVTDWEKLERLLTDNEGGSFNRDEPPDWYYYRPKDTYLKVVVFDNEGADLEYAAKVVDLARAFRIPMFLSVGNDDLSLPNPQQEARALARGNRTVQDDQCSGLLRRARWLVANVVARQWYDVRVLPQLHVLLWGNKAGV